jgi:glutamate/tyrosine decarboxylase-like PLP-dependent enzyme
MSFAATPSSASTANESSAERRGGSRDLRPEIASVLERVDDLDWSAEHARAFADDVLSLWTEWLERLPTLPVSSAAGAAQVRAAVTRDVPDAPLATEELIDALRTIAFDHTTRVGHPGFMGYISGPGTIPGAVADLLAAGLNQNVGGWRLAPAATEIELHLGRWFAGRLGFPAGAGGSVTSGGAMAAFVALKAARDERAGWPVRELGVRAGPPLTCYASDQAHDVNSRAVDMLGLGREAMRSIPSDDDRRMRPDALRAAIARDLRHGAKPFAVVATAGSVSTGAIDPLDDIADLCAEHGLWMHVDGSYGGVAALTDTLRPSFAGIERADSVALDAHKWLYVPHSSGMIVVRDMSVLGAAFAIEPSYLYEEKEASGRGIDLFALGPQFSRGFHALKIWVSLLAHGWSAYERRIAHDVALARYLFARASTHPELEPIGPPPTLSIACFRYVPPELRGGAAADAYLNRLNEALMMDLQLGGRVFPSNAVIDGRFALRACIVNYRTEVEHLDALIDETVARGRALHARLATSR